VTDPTHLAAGPALGYVYQFQVALLELVPHALANGDVEVSLEVFDDVAFDFAAGSPRSVFQVHHSLIGDRELLDTSAKLWNTLGIWAGEWERLQPGESRVMTLLSTQRVRPGTGLASLTDEHADLKHALSTLVAVAEDPSGAAGTADDRAAFLALSDAERRELVRNVRVIDGAPPAVDMHERLETALAPTHERRYIASMADAVEGWWWPRVATALASGGTVHAADLRAAIDDARRSLSSTALPILRLEDFSGAELPSLDPSDARFVRCLHTIAASAVRRSRAVDDYRRAFAHRSRWARRGLLGPGEYERYEGDLLAQWVIACDRMLRALSENADATARAAAGHDLWDTMEADVRQPLRPSTADSFIQRGSLHQLAEDERLAWHPDAAGDLHRALNEGEAAA
jgi:hypothetical protein